MQNSVIDNLVILKDAPMFWRKPSYLKTVGDLNEVSIEIFYSMMFGQESPTKILPYITRASIQSSASKNTFDYLVCIFVPNRQLSGFSYPPVGTNQIDPAALFNASLRKVRYISESEFNLPLTEYKPLVPAEVVESFRVRGGVWP